jgi:hypothetical protein
MTWPHILGLTHKGVSAQGALKLDKHQVGTKFVGNLSPSKCLQPVLEVQTRGNGETQHVPKDVLRNCRTDSARGISGHNLVVPSDQLACGGCRRNYGIDASSHRDDRLIKQLTERATCTTTLVDLIRRQHAQ